MPKSIQTQTAQDLLENAQVYLESLEGSLLGFESRWVHQILRKEGKSPTAVP